MKKKSKAERIQSLQNKIEDLTEKIRRIKEMDSERLCLKIPFYKDTIAFSQKRIKEIEQEDE